MEPLTTVEVWQLVHMLRTGAKGKVCRKLALQHGAGASYEESGLTIPSSGGKVCLGNAEVPAKAVTIDAAPGTTDNKLFTLVLDNTGELHGLVMRDSLPVVWRVQEPILFARAGATAAVWTHGMSSKATTKAYAERGNGRLLRCNHTSHPWKLCWVLGFDADGKPAIALFGGGWIDAFAKLDGVPFGEPDRAALEAVRAEPSPFALPAEELAALAATIQREGKRKLAAPKGHWIKEWRDDSKPSSHTSLRIAGNEYRVVPSVKGAVMLGNVVDPASATKLALGGGNNRVMLVWLHLRGGNVTLVGLRLSDELAVRWAIEGELAPAKGTKTHLAFWSPGAERTVRALVEPQRAGDHSTERGITLTEVPPETPHYWIVGYDARNKPAVVLLGELEAVQAFDHGRSALADPKAAATSVARANAAWAAELAGPKLPAASKIELTSIAAAIASGKQKRITKRFSLAWDKTAIPAVKSQLEVGDPGGDSFVIAAGEGPKQVFELFDEENKADRERGRCLFGVRLAPGKVASWKPANRIGVDSGRYGVWSPTFDAGDLDEGTHVASSLGAKIIATAEGDCAFGSLLGLDAKKRPVAFLFGEALHDEVFVAKR